MCWRTNGGIKNVCTDRRVRTETLTPPLLRVRV